MKPTSGYERIFPGAHPLHLTILPERGYKRLYFSQESPCTRTNFLYQVDTLWENIHEEYRICQEPLLFDLSALDGVDSAFITILVQAIRIIPHSKLGVLATHPDIQLIFGQLGLPAMVAMFESQAQVEKDFVSAPPPQAS